MHLANLGANVVITGRDSERIKSVAGKCGKVSKQKIIGVVADVLKDEDIKRLAKQTIDTFGRIDILVNNAGIGGMQSITSPDLMDSYEKVMNTNVRGVVFLTSLLVPYLEKTKGSIINISSVTGLRPVSNQI